MQKCELSTECEESSDAKAHTRMYPVAVELAC